MYDGAALFPKLQLQSRWKIALPPHLSPAPLYNKRSLWNLEDLLALGIGCLLSNEKFSIHGQILGTIYAGYKFVHISSKLLQGAHPNSDLVSSIFYETTRSNLSPKTKQAAQFIESHYYTFSTVKYALFTAYLFGASMRT